MAASSRSAVASMAVSNGCLVEERVGDSSRDVLGRIERVVKALLQREAASREETSESRSLDYWVSEKDKLHHEWMQLKAELNLRQSLSERDLETTAQDSETLEQQIEDLEEELVSVKLQRLQDRRMLECLHQQKYLTNQLFPNDHDNSHTSQTLVGKSVQEQTELVTQLLQRLEEVDKLKAELLTVRQDMVTAQRECRELMAVLDKLTAHQDDPVKLSVTKTGDKDSPLHRLQLLLEISKDEVTVLSHTLLRLITGSGVDWSKDEELSKRVLKLGLVSSYL